MSFQIDLMKKIIRNINNQYKNNYVKQRFGKEKNKLGIIRKIFKKLGYIKAKDTIVCAEIVAGKKELIQNAEYLYNKLEDDYSKNLLLDVLTYRLLGYKKVKLPLSNKSYFSTIKKIEKSAVNKADFIQTGFNNWKLHLYDVNSYGFPCKLYYMPLGLFHRFVSCGYEYKGGEIKAEEGDFVIDAGACWGDTALYFAHRVGKNGKVFSFEFLPENVEIFHKNIKLNPGLSDSVTLVQNPLWSDSSTEVACSNSGPGNSILLGEKNAVKYRTLSIDDFVEKDGVEKIDFIKMDIEGAELEALKGAEKAIKKFKPKLSISVYHKESDFHDIPKYIDNLELGYRFYFDHYSIHSEESVLFAVTK